jgi:hypothetical protein
VAATARRRAMKMKLHFGISFRLLLKKKRGQVAITDMAPLESFLLY